MSTELTTTQITTIASKIQANLPMIQRGNEMAIGVLKELQQAKIESDEQREKHIGQLAKVRAVYEKVNKLRVEITGPLDDIKDYLMSFERGLDDKGKDNEFARAKAPVAAYDQWKIDEKKKAELAAEYQRQIAIYKADIKAAVGRALAEMLAGGKKNLIDGMCRWEQSLTLDTIDQREQQLQNQKPNPLKQERYDACFTTNFNRRVIINEADTKAYIESLKTEYPYDKFNADYLALATEIINEYRAKIPAIREELIRVQSSKAEQEKRNAELERQAEESRKQVEAEQKAALEGIDQQKDMQTMEAEFVKQAQTQDLEAGPMKKEASFESENLWLKPFLEVVSIVATSGKVTTIRKKSGDLIDSIGWWLKAFEPLGKEVKGIVLKDVAKTIVKEKKGE